MLSAYYRSAKVIKANDALWSERTLCQTSVTSRVCLIRCYETHFCRNASSTRASFPRLTSLIGGEGGALRHRHQSSTTWPRSVLLLPGFLLRRQPSLEEKEGNFITAWKQILADHFISSFCYRVNGISAPLRILSVRLFRCDSTLKLMCPSLVPNLMKPFLSSQLGKKKVLPCSTSDSFEAVIPPVLHFFTLQYKIMFPQMRGLLTFHRQGEPPVGKQQESSPTSSFWVVSANNGCVLLFSGIWIVPTKEKRNGSYHMDFRRVPRVV